MAQRLYVTDADRLLAAPDAPTIDSIEPGNGQAVITFTPGADNGSPITGYRYIKDDGSVTSTILGTTGTPVWDRMDAAGNVYTANQARIRCRRSPRRHLSHSLEQPAATLVIALDAAGNVYTVNGLE